MKQSEIIKTMSSEEVKNQLLLSQSFFFLFSIVLSYFLFDHITDWFFYFKLNGKEILYFGVFSAIIIVLLEVILYLFLPDRYFDDGGINEKVFKNQTIGNIFLIAIVVAIAEEFLFRGVIQTTFGYVFASTLFVLVHFRYLKKPILLVLVIFISFYIGYIFELTKNLFVVIAFHFVVDFLLGLFMKYKK